MGEALRLYHRHTVRGMSHLAGALAGSRPVILVGNHCMDVADPLMFAVAVQRELGRRLTFIGHEALFFRLPVLRQIVTGLEVVPSRHPELADERLRRDGLLMLYPGAATEAALRLYRREPYLLKWYGKLGFVELALRHRARILFVAGIGIDELYYQTDLPIPSALLRLASEDDPDYYRGARLQIGSTGLHVLPAIWPLPVRVTHVISEPLALDLAIDAGDRRAVDAAQVRLWAECQHRLDDAIVAREGDSDWLDRICRRGIASLQWIGL